MFLAMFFFFWLFQPWCSYKRGSNKKKECSFRIIAPAYWATLWYRFRIILRFFLPHCSPNSGCGDGLGDRADSADRVVQTTNESGLYPKQARRHRRSKERRFRRKWGGAVIPCPWKRVRWPRYFVKASTFTVNFGMLFIGGHMVGWLSIGLWGIWFFYRI